MSANAGDTRDAGSIPGVGNGIPLQDSCLKNRMDRRLAGYSPWGLKETPCMHIGELTDSLLSHVQLFATWWSVARQAPLSMGFFR